MVWNDCIRDQKSPQLWVLSFLPSSLCVSPLNSRPSPFPATGQWLILQNLHSVPTGTLDFGITQASTHLSDIYWSTNKWVYKKNIRVIPLPSLQSSLFILSHLFIFIPYSNLQGCIWKSWIFKSNIPHWPQSPDISGSWTSSNAIEEPRWPALNRTSCALLRIVRHGWGEKRAPCQGSSPGPDKAWPLIQPSAAMINDHQPAKIDKTHKLNLGYIGTGMHWCPTCRGNKWKGQASSLQVAWKNVLHISFTR